MTTDTGRVLTKVWLVLHRDSYTSIQDAATASKAKWQDFQEFGDDPYDFFAPGLTCRRRTDLDGLTEHQAHRVVWPCKQDPCPGCACCERGWCRDEDIDDG